MAAEERGYYLNGFSEERSIESLHYPQIIEQEEEQENIVSLNEY